MLFAEFRFGGAQVPDFHCGRGARGSCPADAEDDRRMVLLRRCLARVFVSDHSPYIVD